MAACVVGLGFAGLGLAWPEAAGAADEIDRLTQSGQLPADIRPRHAYSDFTDNPVGRFMDMLAAGGLTEAKELQPAACSAWVGMRDHSALTGTFWVGGTQIDMDTVCGLR